MSTIGIKTAAFLLLGASQSVSFSYAQAPNLPLEFENTVTQRPTVALTSEEQSERNLFNKSGKDGETSLPLLNEFISAHPDSATGYELRAEIVACSTKSPDTSGVYRDATKAISLGRKSGGSNDDIRMYNIAAKAALRLKRSNESLEILQRGIARHLNDSAHFIFVENDEGKRHEDSLCTWSLDDIDVLAKAEPNDWRSSLVRGLYYAKFVDSQNPTFAALALENYKRASLLNPKSPIPYVLEGDIEIRKLGLLALVSQEKAVQQNLKAVAFYTEAIAADPGFTQAYEGRAEANLEAKQYEQAVKDFDKVLSLQPDNASSLTDRGIAYSELHQYMSAISSFNEAIPIEARGGDLYLPRLYTLRADARAAIGAYSAAAADYTSAIALDLQSQLTFMTTSQVRKLFPELSSYSDENLCKLLYASFSPNLTYEMFVESMHRDDPSSLLVVTEDLYEKRAAVEIANSNLRLALADYKRILGAYSPGIMDRWQPSGIGSYLIDAKSSTVEGAPSLWMKENHSSGGATVINFQVDCSSHSIREAALLEYDRQGIAKSGQGHLSDWNPIVPDTVGESMWDASCH